jgi:hypothetical protein
MSLRLTPPTKNVFYGSVVLGVLGLIGELASTIPILSPYSFWILLLGFLLLGAGVAMKGF